MRAMAFATALALVFAGPALADAPMATAAAVGPGAPQSDSPAPPLPSPALAAADGQPMAMGPCGPEKVRPDGTLDTAPHGEVEAGIGTNGYRHLAGSVCQPIGQTGSVSVGVSETTGDGDYRRR